MRKKILSIILAALIISPIKVFATEATLTDPGITPDSPVYALDMLAENVQLALTTDGEKEVIVLDAIAEERLAESEQMLEENKTDLAQEALNDYTETLDKITEQLDTAISNGEDITDTVTIIDNNISDNEGAVEEIINSLPEDSQEAIEDKVDEVTSEIDATKESNDVLTDNEENTEVAEEITSERKISELQTVTKVINNQAFMDEATKLGLNTRQMLTLKSLADVSGKSLEDILKVYLDNDKSMGLTLKTLELKANEIMKTVNKDFKSAKVQINTTFKAEKNTKKTDISTEPETEVTTPVTTPVQVDPTVTTDTVVAPAATTSLEASKAVLSPTAKVESSKTLSSPTTAKVEGSKAATREAAPKVEGNKPVTSPTTPKVEGSKAVTSPTTPKVEGNKTVPSKATTKVEENKAADKSEVNKNEKTEKTNVKEETNNKEKKK